MISSSIIHNWWKISELAERIRKAHENPTYKMNGCCVSAVTYLEVYRLGYNSENNISSIFYQPTKDRVNWGHKMEGIIGILEGSVVYIQDETR